ncbi:DUF6164 family protein [Halomonas sp. LS-001]
MAHLLFRLRHVTEEEALEVRQLLEEQGFDTYETQAGFFRLGVEAIWLRDNREKERAQAVLADYQAKRFERVRREHQDALANGEAPTLWRRLVAHPLQVALVILAVAMIILLTLLPFIGLVN